MQGQLDPRRRTGDGGDCCFSVPMHILPASFRGRPHAEHGFRALEADQANSRGCLYSGRTKIGFPGLRPDHDIWCVGLLGGVRRDNRPSRQLLSNVPANPGRVRPL